MPAKAPEELERLARKYVVEHYPTLGDGVAGHSVRQAKTPGAPQEFVFDFSGKGTAGSQRLRLVLNGEGKVVKVAASR